MRRAIRRCRSRRRRRPAGDPRSCAAATCSASGSKVPSPGVVQRGSSPSGTSRQVEKAVVVLICRRPPGRREDAPRPLAAVGLERPGQLRHSEGARRRLHHEINVALSVESQRTSRLPRRRCPSERPFRNVRRGCCVGAGWRVRAGVEITVVVEVHEQRLRGSAPPRRREPRRPKPPHPRSGTGPPSLPLPPPGRDVQSSVRRCVIPERRLRWGDRQTIPRSLVSIEPPEGHRGTNA